MTLYWKDVNGRNWPVCSCLQAWLPAYQDALLRLGVIKHGLDVFQAIGGAAASGGTHATGQCVDTGQRSELAIKTARQMGADASWSRPQNWDNAGGIPHAHLNLRGCPHGTAAADRQYTSTFQGVDHGKNGLANGAPDPGPKPLSHRTWKEGIAWAKAQQPDPTTLRVGQFNFPGPDKLPKPADRIKAMLRLVADQRLHVIGWNELVGIKKAGVASDFAHDVDAALGDKWRLVKPTRALNENYISYRGDVLKLVAQYDDSILEARTGGRHLTRAVFQYKDGFTFAVGQTHLVNGDTAQHEADRQAQAKDALKSMLAVTAKHDACPFIIQGDPNTAADLTALVKGGLKLTRKYADQSTTRNDATYTNYAKTVPSTNAADWLIDHQYAWGFYVVAYNVIRDVVAGKYRQPRASDHDLVVTTLRSS